MGETPLLSTIRGSSIRPASFDDYEGIAAVEERNGLTPKPREQWLDLWLANPAFHELRQWPIGWVIEDRSGRIVGSLGNIPTLFYFGRSRYVASAGRGWAVDAEYRKLSILLLSRQIQCRDADMNVVTTPGRITSDLCTKLGWLPMPVGRWDCSEFWVLDYASALRNFLAAKAPRVGAFANAIAKPFRRTSDVPDQTPQRRGYHLDWCTEFDKRFDSFWEDLAHRRSDVVLGARDARTLRWHFKYSLLRRDLWILTATVGLKLAGYAILERRDAQALGVTRVVLIDLQISPDHPEMWANMLQAIRARCMYEKIDILENLGCWLGPLHPLHRPPHRRKLDWCAHLYKITNPDLKITNSAWYPTQYDGDASL